MGSGTYAGSFTRAEAERALMISGIQGAALVERHKPQTDTRYCVGIRYQKPDEMLPLLICFETVVGVERWNELMRVVQIDQVSTHRVVYFPGHLLTEDEEVPADAAGE